ncbi:MAG: TlpA family protein disulfide reductase [Spirochaetia bacterium]|nr:TlpA family protein disulfide reductase [Spirochaetia bacterium]
MKRNHFRSLLVKSTTARALIVLLLAFMIAQCAKKHPIETLDGSQYSDLVKSHQGKVLLVNVWATWCDPCLEEMPGLVSAATQFKPEDVSIVLIAADSLNLRDTTIPAFLKKVNSTFPAYIQSPGDPQGLIDAVDKEWGGELPYTVVYDRTGRKVYGKPAPLTRADFVRVIGDALKGK